MISYKKVSCTFYNLHAFIPLLVCLFLLPVKTQATGNEENLRPITITATITPNVLYQLETILANNPCHTKHKLKQRYVRPIYETLIMCRALYHGGVKPSFRFITVPNYEIGADMVKTGQAHTMLETMWYEHIEHKKTYHSRAVIHHKLLEKGLFTVKDHPLHSIPADEIEIEKFRAITVMSWEIDLNLLLSITRNTYTTASFQDLIPSLESNRADYTIIMLRKDPSTVFEHQGKTLYPISGVKLALPSSRHFIFARHMQFSQVLFDALQKGLKTMHENGELKYYQTEMGLFNPLTKDWRLLNNEIKFPTP